MLKLPPESRFDADDWMFISEMLRIADTELRETLERVNGVYPESNLCERLRVWLDQSEDIRARIRRL